MEVIGGKFIINLEQLY